MIGWLVDFTMLSHLKKRQQNENSFSGLGEFDTEFMIEQSIKENQTEKRANTANGNITLEIRNNPIQVGVSQVDMHALY